MHAMHEMQLIVTDVRGVRPSVCLSRGSTRLRCAKTAERIKMPFVDVSCVFIQETFTSRSSKPHTRQTQTFYVAMLLLNYVMATDNISINRT